jgi:hypothetical protein
MVGVQGLCPDGDGVGGMAWRGGQRSGGEAEAREMIGDSPPLDSVFHLCE